MWYYQIARVKRAIWNERMSGDPVVTLPSPAQRPRSMAVTLAGDDYLGGGRLAELPSPLRHPISATVWAVRAAFGIASLIFLLALLAAIPIVNFLVLGYLLEAEGRLARTGKLRGAIPLLSIAPRLGAIALGIWLWVLPLRLLTNAAADARLIDPAGRAAARLAFLTTFLSIVIALHICFALARGGSFGAFFRPIKNVRWTIRQLCNGGYFERATTEILAFVSGLRLRHHFSLGFRGFLGAFVWLLGPTILFSAATRTEGLPIFITVLGGILLIPVFAWLPFLQARFATENRLRAMIELRAVRRLFCRAPFAWLLALGCVYVLAFPLYLLKVVLLPQDAIWFVTLVFIVSIYPARLVTGWAYGRAERKERVAWFGFRCTARALILPLLVLYIFLLFFTQFVGTHGKGVLFEHHAFLLPSPFLIFSR
jgi:hypothetical protein